MRSKKVPDVKRNLKLFDFVGAPLLFVFFGALYLMETRLELRRRTQNRNTRTRINIGVAAPSFVALRFGFLPLVVWLARQNETWKLGLHGLVNNEKLRIALAFLLLDYTNYWWHILNHRLDVLWRIHRVHHTDLDLDVLTSIRFHVGEMIGSMAYRGLATLLSGASPRTVLVYELVYEAANNFHHSNLRLPLRIEQRLNALVVTPRMHGIHHSVVERETDSNFSVVFSFWDRLHRTLRLGIPQHEITIGVPAFRDSSELTLPKLLTLPFEPLRDWRMPDGVVPERTVSAAGNTMKP